MTPYQRVGSPGPLPKEDGVRLLADGLPLTTFEHDTAEWIPAGSSFSVGSRAIHGGMVYLGTGSDSDSPCVINPKRTVQWAAPDTVGATMGYWPAYSSITPNCRAAYLEWLDSSRNDPDTYIGYVFLFFYGIEKRILSHSLGCTEEQKGETASLLAEVARLFSVYRHNSSFRRYSISLLELGQGAAAADSAVPLGSLSPPAWNADRRHHAVPPLIQAAIGRHMAAGSTIPADWALAYYLCDPQTTAGGAVRRLFEEFQQLFHIRYNENLNSSGLRFFPTKSPATVQYHAASSEYSHANIWLELGVPAPTTGFGRALQELADGCIADLDALYRFRRRVEDPSDAETAAYLPDDLVTARFGTLLNDARSWAEARIGGGSTAVVGVDEIAELFTPGREVNKHTAATLSLWLQKAGYGIEPDTRFGSPPPKPGGKVVLFRQDPDAFQVPSTAYAAAAGIAHLSAAVAAADGHLDPAERGAVAAHMEQTLGLDAAERNRIDALLTLLAEQGGQSKAALRKARRLPASDKEPIGRLLVDIAAADGNIAAEEVSALVDLFNALGLDESEVYRQAHAAFLANPEPITVRPATRERRWAIPEQRNTDGDELRLDPGLIAAREEDTARAAEVLAAVFIDESPTGTTEPVGLAGPVSVMVGKIPGLDFAHTDLAAQLAARERWTRSDAERAAVACGLPFLDGALDAVNEAFLDLVGEPLTEGDDLVTVNPEAKELILS